MLSFFLSGKCKALQTSNSNCKDKVDFWLDVPSKVPMQAFRYVIKSEKSCGKKPLSKREKVAL